MRIEPGDGLRVLLDVKGAAWKFGVIFGVSFVEVITGFGVGG